MLKWLIAAVCCVLLILCGTAHAAPNSGVGCAGPAIPKPAGGYWTCTFDDEFSGSHLDTSKWHILTSATGAPINTPACYTTSAANVSVSAGYLHLTARKTPVACSFLGGRTINGSYTSGAVASNGAFSQTYGRFAVRAAFPPATIAGLQSSLWLYPTKAVYGPWPRSGEIDVAESYSAYPDRVIPTLHYDYDSGTVDAGTHTNVVTNDTCMIGNIAAFHRYVLEWTKTALTISYDGHICLVDKPQARGMSGSAPFDIPFFMILTQALGIGGNRFDPATTPLPASTRVDWVRIWK